MIPAAIFAILAPLAAILVVEVVVASLFDPDGPELRKAVAAVNLVTTPPLLFLAVALFGLGVGVTEPFVRIPGMPGSGGRFQITVASWVWLTLGLMEVAITFIEWRLLVWTLAGRAGGQWKLLAVSLATNAASAAIGIFLPLAVSALLFVGGVLFGQLFYSRGGPIFMAVIAGVVLIIQVCRQRARRRLQMQDQDRPPW